MRISALLAIFSLASFLVSCSNSAGEVKIALGFDSSADTTPIQFYLLFGAPASCLTNQAAFPQECFGKVPATGASCLQDLNLCASSFAVTKSDFRLDLPFSAAVPCECGVPIDPEKPACTVVFAEADTISVSACAVDANGSVIFSGTQTAVQNLKGVTGNPIPMVGGSAGAAACSSLPLACTP